jgi:hypothetical protein
VQPQPVEAILQTTSAISSPFGSKPRLLPLDQRVGPAEQQPTGDRRVDVGPDVAFGLRLLDQVRNQMVNSRRRANT